jgi:hypothetical protein
MNRFRTTTQLSSVESGSLSAAIAADCAALTQAARPRNDGASFAARSNAAPNVSGSASAGTGTSSAAVSKDRKFVPDSPNTSSNPGPPLTRWPGDPASVVAVMIAGFGWIKSSNRHSLAFGHGSVIHAGLHL